MIMTTDFASNVTVQALETATNLKDVASNVTLVPIPTEALARVGGGQGNFIW